MHLNLQTCVSLTIVAPRFTNAIFRFTIKHTILLYYFFRQIASINVEKIQRTYNLLNLIIILALPTDTSTDILAHISIISF